MAMDHHAIFKERILKIKKVSNVKELMDALNEQLRRVERAPQSFDPSPPLQSTAQYRALWISLALGINHG